MPIPTLSGLRRLARLARESDALVIHDALYLTSLAAFLCAKRHRKPVVLVQHIADVPYRNFVLRTAMRLGNDFLARPLLGEADQVVFISERTRSAFAKIRYRTAPALFFNGVDAGLFRPASPGPEKARHRQRFDLPLDRPVVLFVGRFVEKKGLTFLQRLARERPDVTFAFAGSGPHDPSLWRMPNVLVLGALEPRVLADLYRASDLLLLPSVGEGFPLVVQEAMASGLDVICGFDSSEADPLAAPFLRGVEISADDPDGTVRRLSRALREALERPLTPDEMQARTEFARARYAWAGVATQYLSLLRALVRARGLPGPD